MHITSSFNLLLKNRIDLRRIPFTERGSRLMVFSSDQRLSVRLAERWFKREPALSAYRQRPPLIYNLQFTDAADQPLAFDLTTYPHRLDFTTSTGVFRLCFADTETLLFELPAGRCGLRFSANLDLGQTDRRGGVLRLTGDIRRNIAYTTNAEIYSNQIEPEGYTAQAVQMRLNAQPGDCLLLNITPRLGFNRYLPDLAEVYAASDRHWQEWFAAAPPVAPEYQAQYYFAWWVMRAGLISTRFFTTREAMTPSKIHYVGVWQWDAYFHALAYRHLDLQLAQDQLRIMLDHQRADGMIPDAVHDEGTITHLTFPVEADVTKPPLLAWAAWKLYEHTRDREFIAEIYEPVVRWNNWWFEHNDLDGDGLCEYQHPFSSGLDDSPLWDQGMPVTSPDLNTYLCLQQDALAHMAALLEMPEHAAVWAQRAEAMVARMQRSLWDETAGLFWAQQRGLPIRVRTPFSLFPLLTGRLPAEITRRLVAHLTDPDQFWCPYPLPSVALNEAAFSQEQMWRGPTWININYLMIEGLQRCGYPAEALELRRRTLELVANQPDIYEYYNPLTGAAPPKAATIFGWSAAMYIDLAIQASVAPPHPPG